MYTLLIILILIILIILIRYVYIYAYIYIYIYVYIYIYIYLQATKLVGQLKVRVNNNISNNKKDLLIGITATSSRLICLLQKNL